VAKFAKKRQFKKKRKKCLILLTHECIFVCTQQKGGGKMKKKTLEERAVRVNVSLAPKTLECIDANVERIARWLLRKGADEKQVRKTVTRSALIKEMVESLGTETGYHSMLMGFSMALGVHGMDQVELLED